MVELADNLFCYLRATVKWRKTVSKYIRQLWIKLSNPSSKFIVHKSWHSVPSFSLSECLHGDLSPQITER